jgi:hypothetical protein
MVALVSLGAIVILVVDVLPTGRSGAITGHVYRYEGLSGPDGPPAVGGLVTVFARSGRVVAHERVHDGKPFHFVLPGGEYNLAGDECSSPTPTLVKPRETTVFDIQEVCGVP